MQSSPSARNSLLLSEGRSSKDYGADQQRLQISELHFDKFTTSATFACWKKRFKSEVCTCSQFPTEAMQWIKEVELVESVYDLKSSRSIKGTHGPNFAFTRSWRLHSRRVPWTRIISWQQKHKTQMWSGSILSGKKPTCQHTINLFQFIAQQVPCRLGFLCQSRAKCQDFVVRYKDSGPYAIASHFGKTNTTTIAQK